VTDHGDDDDDNVNCDDNFKRRCHSRQINKMMMMLLLVVVMMVVVVMAQFETLVVAGSRALIVEVKATIMRYAIVDIANCVKL